MESNKVYNHISARDNYSDYGVFVNPFVDEGFKIIFGQEEHKDILINVLNIIFEGEVVFKDIIYIDKEIPRSLQSNRGIIFDVLCETDKGEKVVVEMQNKRQSFFEQRAAYYKPRLWFVRVKPGTSGITISRKYTVCFF